MKLLLLGWIAATVAAFWLAPLRFRASVVLSSGALALAYVSPASALCLGLLALVGEGMTRRETQLAWYLQALPAVGLLVVHKFLLLGTEADEAILFMGASYYTLRLLHAQFQRPLLRRPLSTSEWFAYAFFAPVLAIGPFARIERFQADLQRSRFDSDRLARGIERIIVGHAKWIVGAGFVVGTILAPFGARLAEHSPVAGAHFDNLLYGADLYLRFAGYSDIAIGFGLMMGFEIVENFDRPFLATSIVDFWRRWHRSLGEWCRDYIYLPIVATGQRATLAVLAAMMTLAVWHEFSLRYVLWGLYHATGIAVYRRWQLWGESKGRAEGLLPDAVAIVLTFVFVVSGFAITRADDLRGIVENLSVMFGGSPG